MALFLAVEVRLKSGEAHGAPNLAGWSPARPTARRISPVEVRRGPQRAEPRRLKSGEAHSAPNLAGWSPARTTARRISPVEVRRGPQRAEPRRLKSSEAHSAPNLAGWSPARTTARRLSPVEVRRGPLLSRAGRWDLARLTAIKSWQMRSGGEEGGRRRKKEEEGRRSRASDIKSNNPHLAGGEQQIDILAMTSKSCREARPPNLCKAGPNFGSQWCFFPRNWPGTCLLLLNG